MAQNRQNCPFHVLLLPPLQELNIEKERGVSRLTRKAPGSTYVFSERCWVYADRMYWENLTTQRFYRATLQRGLLGDLVVIKDMGSLITRRTNWLCSVISYRKPGSGRAGIRIN